MVDMVKCGALALLMTTMACGGSVDVFGAGGSSGEGGEAGDEPIVIGGTGGQGATTGGQGASNPTGGNPTGGSSTGGTTGTGGASSGAGGNPGSGSGGASSGSGGSTSTGGSTGSGSLTCDNSGSCDTCVSCAWNGPCQGYASACLANPDCVAIIQCYQQCTADDCTTPCWIPNPNGQADYLAASICVTCDNCYADCDGGNVGCPENP